MINGRQDTQHNDNQNYEIKHNNNHHNIKIIALLSKTTVSINDTQYNNNQCNTLTLC